MSNFDLTRPATRLQQRFLEPAPEHGIQQTDCLRTAIAMVLGVSDPEEVPHLGNHVGPAPEGMGWAGFAAWLAERGVQIVHVPLPHWSAGAIESRLPHWLGRAPAVLSGRTSGGFGHAVAVINGEIVDTVPWSEGNPLTQPDTDGLFWLTLLVPMRAPTA